MKEPYIARTQGDRIQMEIIDLLKSIDKSLQALNTVKPVEPTPVKEAKRKTVKKEVK